MKSQTGNTVIEMLLYLLLLTIFLLAMFNLFGQIISSRSRSASVSLIQRNGNFLINKISQDIRQSSSISVPATIGTSAVSLSLNIGSSNFVYSQNSGLLIISHGGSDYVLHDLGTHIENFSVHRFGNSPGKPVINVGFTLFSDIVETISAPRSQSYNFSVSLR